MPIQRSNTRDAFPAFFAQADKNHPGWDTPEDWSDPGYALAVTRLIDEEIHRQIDAPDSLRTLALAIIADLRAIQAGLAGDALTLSRFPQVHLGVCMMDFGRQSGMHQVTYDWVILSASDNEAADQEVVFDYPRFQALMRVPDADFTFRAMREYFGWLNLLYDYSSRQGAHRAPAADLAPGLLSVLRSMVEADGADEIRDVLNAAYLEQAAPAVCALVTWSHKNQFSLSYDPRPLLERVYENLLVPPAARGTVGMFFASRFGAGSESARVVWAARTLSDHAEVLSPYDRLKLLVTLATSPTATALPQGTLREGVRCAVAESLAVAQDDRPLFCYAQARHFEVIEPLVMHLAEYGRLDDLLRLLADWYAVEEGDRRTGRYLLCIGSHERGVFYSLEGRPLLLPQDQDASLAQLAEAGNRFFGTNLTLGDTPGLEPHVARRPGIPSRDEGPRYEEAVRAHYRPGEMSREYGVRLAEAEGLLAIHGTRDPLQPVIASEARLTLPLITSFQRPEPDRAIRRVLVWSGGTFLGAIGVGAAAEFLSQNGVVCDMIPDEDRSAEELARRYAADEYDVVWVDAHAEYDHYDPHRVYLRLFPGDDRGLSLAELAAIPVPRGGRRLLFLNVCDGGTATPMPGPSKLGLAPMLAGARQAVVSHLWPVEQTYAVLLDGLLAVGLVRAKGFLAAFSLAAESLRAGGDSAFALLAHEMGEGCELVKRLSARSLELDNAAAWGSPAFFE